jgi:hypothetical protein
MHAYSGTGVLGGTHRVFTGTHWICMRTRGRGVTRRYPQGTHGYSLDMHGELAKPMMDSCTVVFNVERETRSKSYRLSCGGLTQHISTKLQRATCRLAVCRATRVAALRLSTRGAAWHPGVLGAEPQGRHLAAEGEGQGRQGALPLPLVALSTDSRYTHPYPAPS